jgi:hypothetical protein
LQRSLNEEQLVVRLRSRTSPASATAVTLLDGRRGIAQREGAIDRRRDPPSIDQVSQRVRSSAFSVDASMPSAWLTR